jgi:hypothetical protein
MTSRLVPDAGVTRAGPPWTLAARTNQLLVRRKAAQWLQVHVPVQPEAESQALPKVTRTGRRLVAIWSQASESAKEPRWTTRRGPTLPSRYGLSAVIITALTP